MKDKAQVKNIKDEIQKIMDEILKIKEQAQVKKTKYETQKIRDEI